MKMSPYTENLKNEGKEQLLYIHEKTRLSDA